MIYFGGLIGKIFEDVNGLVQHALRPLFYNICTLLYKVIIYLYETFEKLCTTRLLSLGVIEELSKRLGLILGIVMLFIVIFSFINNLIDPDTIKDKKKGPMNILKKILVVLVALGFSNFGFNKIYEVQKIVVESHILNKLLLPATISDPENFGGLIAARTFTAFYTIDEDVLTGNENDQVAKNKDKEQIETCTDYISIMQRRIYKYKNFELGNECLNEAVTLELVDVYGDKTKEDRFIIDFSYILCLVTACFLIYFLFSYCISVGVRIFQLAFLEIVSPIAIIGYLQPKDDNMLSKWGKIYISTYIDVFIRITVINFAVFLIAIILDNNGSEYSSLWTDLGDPTGFDKTFIMMILIFALLTFAKKAPDLIKEIFPTGAAKLGLGGFHFKDMAGGGLVKAGMIGAGALGIGAAVGGIGNAIRGGITDKDHRLRGVFGGLAGGLLSGGLAGAKGKNLRTAISGANKAATAQNQRLAAWRAAGGTSARSRVMTGIQQKLGLQTPAGADEMKYNRAKGYNESYNAAKSEAQSEALKHSDKYFSAVVDSDGITRRYSLGQLEKMKDNDKYTAEEQAIYNKAYGELLKNSTEHVMEHNGAIKSGDGVLFDTNGDLHELGNAAAYEYDTNVKIEENMRYLSESDEFKGQPTHDASGEAISIIERAKNANKGFEKTMVQYNTDERIRRNKADEQYNKKN